MPKHADAFADAVPLAEPYRHKVGKVTFVVSSFGNPNAAETAPEMILRMLEERVKRESVSPMRKCA